jgi:hypothetical protein
MTQRNLTLPGINTSKWFLKRLPADL